MDILEKLWTFFRKIPTSTLVDEVQHNERLQWSFHQEAPEGESFDDFILDYIQERWDRLAEIYSHKAVIQEEKLLVFRCVEHPEPEELLEQILTGSQKTYNGHLGIYWSLASSSAQCYQGHASSMNELHLGGLVDLSSIDVKGTVLANFHPETGLSEQEVRLRHGRPITLVEACIRKDPRLDTENLSCQDIDHVVRKA